MKVVWKEGGLSQSDDGTVSNYFIPTYGKSELTIATIWEDIHGSFAVTLNKKGQPIMEDLESVKKILGDHPIKFSWHWLRPVL